MAFTVDPLPPEVFADLDPGVRETVRWLRERGFETVDSGDGRSKFQPDSPYYVGGDYDRDHECAVSEEPHVAILVPPHLLVARADELAAVLEDAGLPLGRIGPGDADDPPSIQATYDPCCAPEHSGLLLLCGVTDELMRRHGLIP